MDKRLKIFLLSFLTPGLGYLQNGDQKSFYKTVVLFFGVLVSGIALRLFTSFWGLMVTLFALAIIYVFAAVQATLKANAPRQKMANAGLLKFGFTLIFLLITCLSFANRRTVMGFDIMSMSVPVMQPTLMQGDRFIVNTWINKAQMQRGAIVVHSFNGQKGLYVNRIIAIEGDKIKIEKGAVLINGRMLVEPYVLPANLTRIQSRNMMPLTVPKGRLFVMGDNRDASFGDSRFNGTIAADDVVGKATAVISSGDRAKTGTTLK